MDEGEIHDLRLELSAARETIHSIGNISNILQRIETESVLTSRRNVILTSLVAVMMFIVIIAAIVVSFSNNVVLSELQHSVSDARSDSVKNQNRMEEVHAELFESIACMLLKLPAERTEADVKICLPKDPRFQQAQIGGHR